MTGALRGSSAKSNFGCEEAITQTRIKNEKSPAEIPRGFLFEFVKRKSVFGRPGSVLLFQALRLSTIGAEDFDGRVRNGIG